jgi:hypothetical protein
MSGRDRNTALRLGIAREAARIVSESGRRDFHAAKRKAAERLGARGKGALPTNQEVESALLEHQRLFHRDDHHQRIERMIDDAQAAMEKLAAFEPRLVGALANGNADENSMITLHVFSDPPEDVPTHLTACELRYRSSERRVKYSESHLERVPTYQITLGEHDILLLVFPRDGLRQAPLAAVGGRPARRLSTGKLDELRAHYQDIRAPW